LLTGGILDRGNTFVKDSLPVPPETTDTIGIAAGTSDAEIEIDGKKADKSPPHA
jgi:hypothetical protein